MERNSDYVMLYMTAATADEAARIGRALVEDKLVACVNILGPIRSMYRWKGEVHDEPEISFIAKTRADLVEAATARVRALHSYECPCVVALPIVGGNPAFLKWIADETHSDSP